MFNKNYNIPSLKHLIYLFKKFLFIKKKINLVFINLLDIFILNKYFYKNFPTNILIFNNSNINSSDFYLCNIIIESESIIFKKKLYNLYIYFFVHGILHFQKFLHKKYFLKKNIFNYLEFKMIKKIGLKKIYNNVNIYKYNKYID